MEKLSMCRICLAENVRMRVVTNKSLQELYEKLTGIPFITEDRKPMLACLFCSTRLKQCCQLQRQCVEAEELLAQLLSEDYEQKPFTNRGRTKFVGGFIITPTENISVVDDCQIGSDAIKQELPAVYEERGDVELQPEHLSDELDPLSLYNSHLDVKVHHASEHEEDQYVMEIEIEGEDEHELSENRRVRDTERAAVAKKPTLKRKLREIIPAKQRINVPSGVTTETSTSECVDQIKEPVTTASQSSFNQSSEVIQETGIHSGENPLKCTICQRVFSNKSNLNKHLQIHSSEKRYKCDICHRSGSHVQFTNHCSKQFFTCDICLQSFCYRSDLIEHISIHTGEKPYKCNICQGSFRKKSTLTAHFKTHTGEKRYKCDQCPHSSRDNNSLMRHMRLHTGEKPYKCDVCQRSFISKSSLKKHSWLHTGEKPYKCDVCQRSFTCNSNLTIHLRTHSGEKPYQCNICQRSFSIKNNLNVHFRKHSGVKPYHCDICERSFNTKHSLDVHLKKHSAEKPKGFFNKSDSSESVP